LKERGKQFPEYPHDQFSRRLADGVNHQHRLFRWSFFRTVRDSPCAVALTALLQDEFQSAQAQTPKDLPQHCLWTYLTGQGRPNIGKNGQVDLQDPDWKKLSKMEFTERSAWSSGQIDKFPTSRNFSRATMSSDQRGRRRLKETDAAVLYGPAAASHCACAGAVQFWHTI
jgi:hypothetical protein